MVWARKKGDQGRDLGPAVVKCGSARRTELHGIGTGVSALARRLACEHACVRTCARVHTVEQMQTWSLGVEQRPQSSGSVRLRVHEHRCLCHGGELRGSTLGTRSAGNVQLDAPWHRGDQKVRSWPWLHGVRVSAELCSVRNGSAARSCAAPASPACECARARACMVWTGRVGSRPLVCMHVRACA